MLAGWVVTMNGGDGEMKKSIMLLLAFMVALGLLLMPVISSAVPNDYKGKGNHRGWSNGNSNPVPVGNSNSNGGTVPVPEPLTLFLLGSGIVGLAGWTAIRNRTR
jgi:hypothetical protein